MKSTELDDPKDPAHPSVEIEMNDIKKRTEEIEAGGVDELAKLRLEIAIAKFEAVLHQSNEDVKTMPPLPPRTPIQAALNFGIIPNADHYVYRSNEAQVIDEMKKFLGTLP